MTCPHNAPVIAYPRIHARRGAPVAICRCGAFHRLRGGDWEPSAPDVVPLEFPWHDPHVPLAVPYPHGSGFEVVTDPQELTAAFARLTGGTATRIGGAYLASLGRIVCLIRGTRLELAHGWGHNGWRPDWTAALPATLDDFERLMARVLDPRAWVAVGA